MSGFKRKLVKQLPANAVCFFLSALIVFTTFPACHVCADDDFQYWNEIEIRKKLPHKFLFKLKSGQRVRDMFTDPFLINSDVGMFYSPNRLWELGSSYKFEYEETPKNAVTREHRAVMETTVKYPIKKLWLANRHRIEYRNLSTVDRWRYRTRLKASYRIKLYGQAFEPFAADEIFYETHVDQVNQNRLISGVAIPIGKHVICELYYLLKDNRKRSGGWGESHVLGTNFIVAF